MEMQSSKIPQLQSFFFCGSLLTGSKIIGYFKAIFQLILAIFLFGMYVASTRDVLRNHHIIIIAGPLVVYFCGLAFIEAYFAIVLLHGLIKRKPAYVKTWVVVQFSILIQNIASLIVLAILSVVSTLIHNTDFEFKQPTYILITIFGDLYCTLVVYSYYRDEYYRDRSGNIINADLLETLE